jgi:hypothetical protein
VCVSWGGGGLCKCISPVSQRMRGPDRSGQGSRSASSLMYDALFEKKASSSDLQRVGGARLVLTSLHDRVSLSTGARALLGTLGGGGGVERLAGPDPTAFPHTPPPPRTYTHVSAHLQSPVCSAHQWRWVFVVALTETGHGEGGSQGKEHLFDPLAVTSAGGRTVSPVRSMQRATSTATMPRLGGTGLAGSRGPLSGGDATLRPKTPLSVSARGTSPALGCVACCRVNRYRVGWWCVWVPWRRSRGCA